ncbi:Panacea domain-containing protein [Clavibacter michiganensis]|uniref:Panacea domain-containing protein n=1 Tax=Clavibacter michiganensis TaxID=28447 RepID=UPI0015580BB9|nr:type II toxin-antitoxin system antitoxin SocA domain-containing protein [Clavibacter michiganensis]
MANVHDVAAFITSHFSQNISTMKLQKLCFFAQGWSLALQEKPLFEEEFQAWRGGPVCYPLFERHKGRRDVSSWNGNANSLTKPEQRVIEAMLSNFAALSGLQLSELTHQPGTPWSTTRSEHNVPEGAPSRAVITQELMRDYFTETLTPSR